jgi:hypothetical protein
LLPDAPGYGEVRQVYNDPFDKHPALIARAPAQLEANTTRRTLSIWTRT